MKRTPITLLTVQYKNKTKNKKKMKQDIQACFFKSHNSMQLVLDHGYEHKSDICDPMAHS